MENNKVRANLNSLPAELQEQIARNVAETDYVRGDELNGNRSIKSLKATSRQFRDVTTVMEVTKNREDLSAVISSSRDLHRQAMASHDANAAKGTVDWESTLRKVSPTLHLQSDEAKADLENRIMQVDEDDRWHVAANLIGHQDKLLPHGKKLVQAAYERTVKVRSAQELDNATEEDLAADGYAADIVGGGRSHLSQSQQRNIAILSASRISPYKDFSYFNDGDVGSERGSRIVQTQKDKIRHLSSNKLSNAVGDLHSVPEGRLKNDLHQSFAEVAKEKVDALRHRAPNLSASRDEMERLARQQLAGATRERAERGR